MQDPFDFFSITLEYYWLFRAIYVVLFSLILIRIKPPEDYFINVVVGVAFGMLLIPIFAETLIAICAGTEFTSWLIKLSHRIHARRDQKKMQKAQIARAKRLAVRKELRRLAIESNKEKNNGL